MPDTLPHPPTSQVCTFKPTVSKAPPPPCSPDDRPPVKGLDTFVAKQEAARLKRAQAEAEAAKAAEELETRVVAVPKEVYTQWTAFSLADPERRKAAEERLKKVQDQLESERTAECTFQPTLITKLPPTALAGAEVSSTAPGESGIVLGSEQTEAPAAAGGADAEPAAEAKPAKGRWGW